MPSMNHLRSAPSTKNAKIFMDGFIGAANLRKRSVVKQVAMAAGLRAQISFWSFHGRAKMRGRMPRPARIVEYDARESDKIGIASSDDRLSLIIASDETDCDDRQVRCSLDGTGERHGNTSGADRTGRQ